MVEQHGEFPSYCHHGSFFGILAATFGDLQTVTF